jgi:hypothetical protein
VTDEPLVENRVNRFPIEVAALGQALKFRALSLGKCHNQPQTNTPIIRRPNYAF